MAVKELNKKLDIALSGNQRKWLKKANLRSEDMHWLKHSRRIAIQINIALKEKKLTQKKLAGMLKVSPQQVNKIMKGRENLTLETISKIENSLSISLIHKPVETPIKRIVKQDTSYSKKIFGE